MTNCALGVWLRDMILASGARGRVFDSAGLSRGSFGPCQWQLLHFLFNFVLLFSICLYISNKLHGSCGRDLIILLPPHPYGIFILCEFVV